MGVHFDSHLAIPLKYGYPTSWLSQIAMFTLIGFANSAVNGAIVRTLTLHSYTKDTVTSFLV